MIHHKEMTLGPAECGLPNNTDKDMEPQRKEEKRSL
jgi:hypothetical protein